jgi:hypothetical protein
LAVLVVFVDNVPTPHPPPESAVHFVGSGAVPAAPVKSSEKTSVL